MTVSYTKGFSADDIAEIDGIIDRMVDDRMRFKALSGDAISQFVIGDDEETLSEGFHSSADILAKVEQDLRRGIEKFPESLDLHSFLSINLKDQLRYEDAVGHMREQARLRPDDADWQIAHAASYMGYGQPGVVHGEKGHAALLEAHEYARTQFHRIAHDIYNMPLTNPQKDTLNQYAAAIDQPLRIKIVDARSPVVRTLDEAGANAVNKVREWIFGPDEPP